MKHSKKMIACCVLAVAVAITMAVPQQIFAANNAKKPTATNVQYVTDENGTRTGIRTFTISPYAYYNLSQDPKINAAGDRTLKLDDAKLLQIAKRQIFPKWGVVAEGIFRDQASQLVTIEGSGMMSSSTTSNNSFDRHFSTGKVSNGYDYKWAVSDLAKALSQETSSLNGKTCWDETRITGITQIGNLDGARTLMGQELRNCSDDNDISKDEFLGNSYQKNEDKRRLPDLEDSKSGEGFANIVTCVNRAGASGDYDYVTFGLAVYDFDVTPVAAQNLKYIEAADEDYGEGDKKVSGQDILLGKAGNVNYIQDKRGISYQKDNENGTTSYLRNNTTQEVTQSSGLENSVTEESTIGTDDTFEWGMEQEIGLELNMGGFGGLGAGDAASPAPCMFPRATLNISNSWHELWSTTKSTSETQSTSKTKTTNTEVTLPGHTVAIVEQSLENTKTTENYQQPVILSYKVAIFAMSGDYFNGAAGGIENSRYDKQWMSVIFDGSDDPTTSGCYALGSLYNRAVTNQDTQGYDGAKGKYRSWCDKSAWNSSSKINWGSVSSTLAGDSRSSHRIPLGTGKKATTIQELATELPLIEKAQMLTSKRESVTSNVEQIVPLYSLGSVSMKAGATEYELKRGDTLYLDSIDLEGYGTRGAEFYEFDKSWGEWVLLDDKGEIIEDGSDQDDAKDTEGTVKFGPITLVTDKNGSQKVTILNSEEGFNAEQELQWRLKPNPLDEKGNEIADKETVIVSNEELTRAADSDAYPFMTNEEKLKVSRPTITLKARDAVNDIVNFETAGSYKGSVDEPVNLAHVFTANAVDESGKIRNVPVFWESKGTSGITVEQSGETSFTKKGTYQVRPFSYAMDGTTKIVQKDKAGDPVWLEVTAQDKAALTSIVMNKPELDEDDTTLSEGTTALGFDLASYTRFYDQYGDKWEGSETDPLPEVLYSVSPQDGAYIDGENILTITSPGTYTVNAKAYDQAGNEAGFTIKSIRITVTEEDRLASITMDEPAMSKSERTLQGQDDSVTVENLKGLLTYLDQHDNEWTGKLPNVTFSIEGDPEDAEIKGGNFYAYAPGTYTIQPSAAGYNINSISITILEDQHLVLETEDPGKQYLYSDGDAIELELERYIDATTSYGSKWKGPVPELKFTMADTENAQIVEETVYEGDDDYEGTDRHYFKTNVTGEYTIHVEPLKASEYTAPLDDMLIRVVRGKKVARIEFQNINDAVAPEKMAISSSTSDYPSIDLSNYLNYYDGYGEKIDPAKDHVKIPDCQYSVTSPAADSEGGSESSRTSYDLDNGVFTAYEPDAYFVTARMNVTNYDPSLSEEDAQEDTILEADTIFAIYDIDWLHNFSGEWVITKEPTCTEDGLRVKRCQGGKGCINYKEGEENTCTEEITESIPATGHNWSKYYKIDRSSHTLYTYCEKCGAINEESRTNYSGNFNAMSDTDTPVPYGDYATCTTTAIYQNSSSDPERFEVPALGHNWTSEFFVKTPPTCTQTGEEYIKYTCTRCGEVKEEFYRSIPKVQHEAADPDPDNWSYYEDENGKMIESCEDYGLKVAPCKFEGCTENVYKLISPLGHNYQVVEGSAKAATCEEDGNEADQKCSRCTSSITGAVIKATGHDYQVVEGSAKAATCEEDGNEADQKCSHCEDVIEGAVIKALGHDYQEIDGTAKAATCTEPGKKADQKCSRCKDVVTGAAIEALGHDWDSGVITTQPTCSISGVRTITCKRDPSHTKTETIAPTGQHVWTSGTVTRPATEDAPGELTSICMYCKATRSEVIPKLEHTHVLEHHAAVEAGNITAGSKEYWSCAKCGLFFGDAQGNNAIAKDSWVIPATGGKDAVDAAAEADTAIANAGKIDAAAYNEASYKIVMEALDALKQVLANPKATATEIRTATSTLESAMAGLKKDQSMTVKAVKKIIKQKKVRKKAKTVRVLTVYSSAGELTYKGTGVNAKSKKALKLNAKTGKIKIRKKTRKGIYKMRVTVTAAGNAEYAPASKTVTVTIKVRK